MMKIDPLRIRLQDDLRGLVTGEVRCDSEFLQLYSTDGGIHEQTPVGVVLPKSEADVQACLAYANEKGYSIHARGAGSGVAGESLGEGIVLDFSCHLRQILELGDDWIRFESGIVRRRLNQLLRSRHRIFGPDPATGTVSTMGSTLAINGAGSHWLKYGLPSDYVRSLRIVLASGDVLDVGQETLTDGVSQDTNPVKRGLINDLVMLWRDYEASKKTMPNPPTLDAVRPRVGRCGYRVAEILRKDAFDLAGLICGSEGTLALITSATVSTTPLEKQRGALLLLFHRIDSAAHTAVEILQFHPTACDLMDRRTLSLAREADSRFANLVPQETEAALLVELDGASESELSNRLIELVEQFVERRRVAFDVRIARDSTQTEIFWQLSSGISPSVYRLRLRPVPGVEDAAIPPESLPSFLQETQSLLRTLGITSAIRVHVGHGGVHLYPFLNLNNPSHAAFLQQLAEHYHHLVRRFGGNIQSEHGIGFSRTPFLRSYIDAATDQLFRQIKCRFDPHGILNPNKLTSDRSDLGVGSFLRKPAIPEDLLQLERLGSVDSLQRLDTQLEREKQQRFQPEPPIAPHLHSSLFTNERLTSGYSGSPTTSVSAMDAPNSDDSTPSSSNMSVSTTGSSNAAQTATSCTSPSLTPPSTHLSNSPSRSTPARTMAGRTPFAELLAAELARDFSTSPAGRTTQANASTSSPLPDALAATESPTPYVSDGSKISVDSAQAPSAPNTDSANSADSAQVGSAVESPSLHLSPAISSPPSDTLVPSDTDQSEISVKSDQLDKLIRPKESKTPTKSDHSNSLAVERDATDHVCQPVTHDGSSRSNDPSPLSRMTEPHVLQTQTTGKKPCDSQAEYTSNESESEETLRDLFELQVDWKPAEMVEYVRPCNGCGDCRARVPEMRTCPIFRVDPREQATPRAKINLVRGILSGKLPREIITKQASREIADLCILCHACSVECPAQVQVAKMMSELRGAYVAANGLSFKEWFVCRLDLWCNFASRFSPVTRNILHRPRFRWLLEKLAGIARNRRLPKISSQPFLRRAVRRGLTQWSRHSDPHFLPQDFAAHRSTEPTKLIENVQSAETIHSIESTQSIVSQTLEASRSLSSTKTITESISGISRSEPMTPSPRVAYFVDLFANYHDPSVAEALVAILKHHQIPVYVPANQTQSGNAAISCGALDLARYFVRRNVQTLVDAVRQGYTILASEPSAVLSLRQEYPMLLPDEEDVQLVANATQDACSFLRELHRQGQLRTDFQSIPLSIGYYQPCRLLALDEGVPDLDLLRLIPELKVKKLVAGCCGMASAYGLRTLHFRDSLRIGRNLASVLRDASFTWVATSCGTCRMQIEQISDKSSCHPLRILATAYGLQNDFKTPLIVAREKHAHPHFDQ